MERYVMTYDGKDSQLKNAYRSFKHAGNPATSEERVATTKSRDSSSSFASAFDKIASCFLFFCCCFSKEKRTVAVDEATTTLIRPVDLTIKSVMSEILALDKFLLTPKVRDILKKFPDYAPFVHLIAKLEYLHNIIATGKMEKFYFFAILPISTIKDNLLTYHIPKGNDDFDTSRWKIVESHGSSVLFEVDFLSAYYIWQREFQLFLGVEQFPLALVVEPWQP